MRHEDEVSRGERTTGLGEGSATQAQRNRELSDAELHQIVGGVQKVHEAAPPY